MIIKQLIKSKPHFNFCGKEYYFDNKKLIQKEYFTLKKYFKQREIMPTKIKEILYYRLSGDLINYEKVIKPKLFRKNIVEEIIEVPF